MNKQYVHKLITFVSFFCFLFMVAKVEAAGRFSQPYIYAHEIYAHESRISIILPYKEGTCNTTESEEHLEKLTRFINAFESEAIPKTTSFKTTLFTTIMQGSSSQRDTSTDFSSRVKQLLDLSNKKTLKIHKPYSADSLKLDTIYVVDEAYLNVLQDRLTTIFDYKLCTPATASNLIAEIASSLFSGSSTQSGSSVQKEHKEQKETFSKKRKKSSDTIYYCCACKKITDKRMQCPGCELAFYCSQTCQTSDLEKHRKQCAGFECSYCKDLTNKTIECEQCKMAFYCSRKCQKAHWDGTHKKTCLASSISNWEI